jgi:hypothetical protein
MISIALLGLVVTKATMTLQMANKSHGERSSSMVLEDQCRRLLDRIAYAVMGSDRDTLFPDPESPIYSDRVTFQISLGVEDGEVVWSEPERIALDEGGGRVRWSRNPDEESELSAVWTNVARPFLEGEVMNGEDDNGNGLVDERGLTFTLEGGLVHVVLTLERRAADGRVLLRTVGTTVSCRN